MTDREKARAFDEILSLARNTNKELKEIKKDTDLSKPIKLDVLKTTKAMFYEQCVHVIKCHKEG